MEPRDADNYWQRLRNGGLPRRRVLTGGATFLTGGIALGLVGCSSSNNNSGSKTAPTQAAPQTAGTAAPARPTSAAATSAPAAGGSPAAAGTAVAANTPLAAGNFKTGGTINGLIVGTSALDPVANTTYRTQWLAGFHYARLFRFNAATDPKVTLSREPIPDLVGGYEVTPDNLTYTMKLRPGINFHPPLSRALTTADVLASYQYFTTSPKNTNSGVYAPIVDSLTAPDNNTMVFKLKQPYAPFLNKLANTQYLWIMSKDAVDNKIDPEQQPIGVGPWIFVSSTPTAFTWKKNPDYWNKGLPYADATVLNIIASTATQEAQYQAGQIDYLWAGTPPPADADALKKAVPKSTTFEYSPNGLNFFFFSNVMDPNSPFKDPRMRQAASLAIDRQGLIDSIYSGKAAWQNIVNAGLGKWHLDPKGKDAGDSARWFKFDPQQAKQLVAAAGHANTDLKFVYPNNAYGDTYNALADAERGMLADAGFKVQAVPVDYLKDWINNGQGYFNKGLPPNSIGSALQTPFTDPDDFLTGMLTKDGNRNGSLVDDPDLAAVIRKQQIETDENKRLQIVYDLQRMQADKMYYVPLIYPHYVNFIQPWVQNYFNVDDYDFGTEQIAYMSVNNK